MSIESLLSHVMGRPVRVVLPPDPDLLGESQAAEKRARFAEAVLQHRDADLRCYGARSVTDDWPDPYGPDLTVFGPYPRVYEDPRYLP